MAVTKIWDVRGNLSTVIKYVDNDEKTALFGKDDISALRDIMNYATNDYKTEKQFYVSGVNCFPETAREQMIAVKQKFAKEGGIIAYHAYQSFAEGEVDADTAHKIGITLAKELWGDRFQVVVATHLNTKCYHNHFVLNSVSFVDGGRYHDCKETYRQLKDKSDEICRQYGISVVNMPQSKGRHYTEWLADKNGRPTWRSLIREDVDSAVLSAFTMHEFIANMRKMGYEVKTGVKYMAVRPEGKERFVRLYSLGDRYTEDAIRNRILYGGKLRRKQTYTRQFNPFGNKGLKGLYYHYLYLLGVFPTHGAKVQNAPFLLREELLKLDHLTEQYEFICRHDINTAHELYTLRFEYERKVDELKEYAESVKRSDDEAYTAAKMQIKALQSDIRLMKRTEEYSVKLFRKLETIDEIRKKGRQDEHIKRSRAGRKHDIEGH
ncbi:MAG: relaxase/mobilization nuclease domain-containing protein [Eubacteriaceae bacterium]|nr:relaxase/mobilization nuclease domain-containing protein [Eubacteriaceae bacterium]